MKICMGTVQFGMLYGVYNRTGQPDRQQVFRMLDMTRDYGISDIDTATAYGIAEELLGEYINERKLAGKVQVISKLRPNLIDENCIDPVQTVIDQVKASLQRLHLDNLEAYLLHTPANIYNAGIIEGLTRCREAGLINHAGVSIYEMKHGLDAVDMEAIDFIQTPYSILDQRASLTGFFTKARKKNTIMHIRSTLIQGLILMADSEIPDHLQKATPYLHELDTILADFGVSRLAAALLFAYGQEQADYLVFGVDTAEQLIEDMDILLRNDPPPGLLDELKKHFHDMDEGIVIPSLWARKA